jgi:TonB family protein
LGLGDIEWGGGGNRVVLFKKLPKYPPGVNTEAVIRIRFTVSPKGNVINAFPLQKGDPLLEKAALDAIKKWRFNPLKDDREMYGIITFTFRLS